MDIIDMLTDSDLDRYPLHDAVLAEDLQQVHKLVDVSFLDPMDALGYTPFYYACLMGSTDAAKCLLERGVNINAMNGEVTPLWTVCTEEYLDILELMLKQPHILFDAKTRSGYPYFSETVRNLLWCRFGPI